VYDRELARVGGRWGRWLTGSKGSHSTGYQFDYVGWTDPEKVSEIVSFLLSRSWDTRDMEGL
jgi:hypothetical protein